jgi:hypothetical protein
LAAGVLPGFATISVTRRSVDIPVRAGRNQLSLCRANVFGVIRAARSGGHDVAVGNEDYSLQKSVGKSSFSVKPGVALCLCGELPLQTFTPEERVTQRITEFYFFDRGPPR